MRYESVVLEYMIIVSSKRIIFSFIRRYIRFAFTDHPWQAGMYLLPTKAGIPTQINFSDNAVAGLIQDPKQAVQNQPDDADVG